MSSKQELRRKSQLPVKLAPSGGSVVDWQPMLTAPRSPYMMLKDAKGPPNKQKKSNSSSAIPAKAKPPASAAISKAPKDSNIPEVKNLDDDELNYDDDVDDDAASDGSNQPLGPLNDDKPQDMDKTPQQDSHDQSSGDRPVECSDGDSRRSENRCRSRSRSRLHQGSHSPSPHDKVCSRDRSGDHDHQADWGD